MPAGPAVGSAMATVPDPDRARAAAPAARRRVSSAAGSSPASVADEPDGALPRPTATITGAFTAPPEGSFVTSPTLADAWRFLSAVASSRRGASRLSSPVSTTSRSPSLRTPTTSASALTVRADVVRTEAVVTQDPLGSASDLSGPLYGRFDAYGRLH